MTTASIAVDASVAVPLLSANHPEHARIARWARNRTMSLSGHALPETYSVLTRLPGTMRVEEEDAVKLIDASFSVAAMLSAEQAAAAHRVLAEKDIGGGAVHDGLVALAALENGMPLATRDARARATYEALGVAVVVV